MNIADISNGMLDRMQYEADPLADKTIARILGPWCVDPDASREVLRSTNIERWRRLTIVNSLIGQWKNNRCLTDWRAPPGTPPEVARALEDYLHQIPGVPKWADTASIVRAESTFTDQGVLSCILLFCASLPECYVIPDLSQVLHMTGQLEQNTDYRIRATAAMVFPVMMSGGLTSPDGAGIAQVVKVRLIHATVRNLILRGQPSDAMAALGGRLRSPDALVLAPLRGLQQSSGMHEALFAHGWNVGKDGLPCNQEEQAYTLLTFHYVFLRALRTLRIGLPDADERAYLHTWNVVGHLLGVRRDLMADTMEEAQVLFDRIQGRGRADRFTPDPRPALTRELMHTMESLIPIKVAKPIPMLLTRHLCGPATARDLGIDGKVSPPAYGLFAVLMFTVHLIDGVVRRFKPDFSLSRFFTRLVGRSFLTSVLMDQTRPLRLPEGVLDQARQTMAGWHEDRKAPRWMNAIERRLLRNIAPAPASETARP
jgi:hypothetical protein